MRILHLAPLWYPVHEDSSGGIETLLVSLLEALRDEGCEQTLVATGDSETCAALVPVIEQNLVDAMDSGKAWEYSAYSQEALLIALELAADFDVVHAHVGTDAYVLSGERAVGDRVLHTHHNDVTPDLEWFIGRHPQLPMTVPSHFQARRLRRHGATRCRLVPNGLNPQRFKLSAGGSDLAFLGRIEFGKGPDIAIRVARNLGRKLLLAGPIIDNDYFTTEIGPHLDDQIRYLGALGHTEKVDLLGTCACTLMPSRWEEPFGLVAIESMACGTPVVALPNGALPEVIDSGLTGYLGRDEPELVARVGDAERLDRSMVRSHALERFAIKSIARRYLDVYRDLVTAAD